MRSLRFLVPVLGLASVSLFAAACSDDGSTSDGEGGAGGEATTPSDGGDVGAGGDIGAGGGCAETGTGTLVIEVDGLPADVSPSISLSGPDGREISETGSFDLGAGNYELKINRVFDSDAIVRTVFDGEMLSSDYFCLGDRSARTVKITYSPIPSSNKLWMTTGKDDELAGFSSFDISEAAKLDATVAVDTTAGISLAFDRDGNLWTVNPIIGGPMLVRIPAAELGESGTRTPDIEINVPEIECFVHVKSIAFDPTGNLWLSACDDQLLRLPADALTTSGDKEADVLLTEVIENAGLAFDASGNLWVATGPTVVRFDAARLETSDIEAPDLALSVISATDETVLGAEQLAFDKAGNLWGVSGSTIFQLPSLLLEETGEKEGKSSISFTIDVGALPSTPAFDESNGLWVDLGEGEFGRFSPEQLGQSVVAGTPVVPARVIASDSITTTLPLAFFPAPAGLPIYSSIPRE